MCKHYIFPDSLLVVSYVQDALLILFFHDKLLFPNDIEQIEPLFIFSICQLLVVLLCLHNRSSEQSSAKPSKIMFAQISIGVFFYNAWFITTTMN